MADDARLRVRESSYCDGATPTARLSLPAGVIGRAQGVANSVPVRAVSFHMVIASADLELWAHIRLWHR